MKSAAANLDEIKSVLKDHKNEVCRKYRLVRKEAIRPELKGRILKEVAYI